MTDITSSQPAVSSPIKPSNRRWFLWLIGGIALLALGAALGVFSAKFLNQSQSPSQLTSTPTPILSPIPPPTPDPTADWKTFTSSNDSVSHNYPESWVLTFGGEKGKKGLFGNSIVQWWSIEKLLTDSSNGKIQINAHLETITPDKKSESFLDCSVFGGCSKVVYYGQEYLTNFEERNGKINSKNYVAINNNELLHIQVVTLNTSENEYKTVDQILSTFKFTGDSTGQRIYKSNKLPGFTTQAFETSYPSSWSLSEDKSNGWLRVEISKENHTIHIEQIPIDGSVCLFSDSPSFEGPSGDLRKISYVEIHGVGTFRRYENVGAATPDHKVFGVCKKQTDSPYYGSLFEEGTVYYQVPTNYNPDFLKEMDSILATLTPIGNI